MKEQLVTTDLLLPGEENGLGSDRLENRYAMAEAIADLPEEVTDRLLILQSSVGCLNRCGFCSQGAGNRVSWLDTESLQDTFGALQAVVRSREATGLGAGREHKPGVIFPYLDNDAGSYPHLDRYVELAGAVGSRVRLATVGYSRHNAGLQAMHEKLATTHEPYVDGIRFSWTPYTFAWANGEHRPEVSREEYVADFGNMLKTYEPLLKTKGPGRDTCSIEMRFKPCIETDPAGMRVETMEDGGQILAVGPYAVVCPNPTNFQEATRIVGLDRSHPKLSNDGVASVLLASSTQGELNAKEYSEMRALMEGGWSPDTEYQPITINGRDVLAKSCTTFRFENCDGTYYAIDPFQRENGHFDALHLYPQSDRRPNAGYADSQRPVMNEIINHKVAMGHGIKDEVPSATPEDIDTVLAALQEQVEFYRPYLPHLAEHIEQEVLPMTIGVADALRQSGLPSSLFFHRHFLTDTGQIVNQGRAHQLHFAGIVSRRDEPTTPNEVKGYGADMSLSAVRGNVWAISFSVDETPEQGRTSVGLKQLGILAMRSGLVIREWDVGTFDNVDPDGNPLRRYFIPAKIKAGSAAVRDAQSGYLMPGVVPVEDVAVSGHKI